MKLDILIFSFLILLQQIESKKNKQTILKKKQADENVSETVDIKQVEQQQKKLQVNLKSIEQITVNLISESQFYINRENDFKQFQNTEEFKNFMSSLTELDENIVDLKLKVLNQVQKLQGTLTPEYQQIKSSLVYDKSILSIWHYSALYIREQIDSRMNASGQIGKVQQKLINTKFEGAASKKW